MKIQKTLIDGRVVDNDSVDWRDECMARALLQLSREDMLAWVNDFEKRHGAEKAERIRDLVRDLYVKLKKQA